MPAFDIKTGQPVTISVTQVEPGLPVVEFLNGSNITIIASGGGVASWNGRTGVVLPLGSDYDADQIDYDNLSSGLTATNAQDAIDEVAAAVPTGGFVESFNGRQGTVTPLASDYDADQVDYDNATSGLAATEVQSAIDEVEGRTPTQNEKDALAGTNGSPSTINRYITDSDPRVNLVVRSVTATTTELANDDIIECDPSLGDIDVNLLSAAVGVRKITIKLTEATNGNTVFIIPNGAETIDGLSEYELDTLNESIQLISDGTNWLILTRTSNEGQVKINTGNALKPTLVYAGGTVGTFQQITYASPLGLSGHPTTTWPKNIDILNRTDADLYDFVNDTFLENKVPGQINTFRIVVNFSGKPLNALTGVILRVENTLSGFLLEDTRTLPSELTAGVAVFNATTIADSASLPSPFGTGQGYELSLYSDDPITLEVDSITRISSKK